MSAFIICLTLASFAAMAYVVFSMLIVHELRKRAIKINFIFLRWFLLKYVAQYKELRQRETGRAGPLFYGWLISINTALACLLIGLCLR